MNTRLDQLRAFMAQEGMDAFLVTEARNRRYLSGFTGSSGALLVTAAQQYLITDFRYFTQAGQQAPDWTLWKVKQNLTDGITSLLNEVRPPHLGFEADGLTVAELRDYQKETPTESAWAATEDAIRHLRAPKEPKELDAIRRAQAITDEAATQLPRLIQPGKTEREVAWELEKLLRDLGAEAPAFEIILASGPNSALPHARPTARVIEPNEIVLVDFGARLDGYHSDMTRSYFTGEPSEQYRTIFAIVLEALERAERALKAGLNARAGDALARDFIKEQGYGDFFGHGLGHGVGLDIHELPPLSFRAPAALTLGVDQIVTIEPGIYLPDWGGIRIEDLVRVTAEGIEILTQTPKAVDAWREGNG